MGERRGVGEHGCVKESCRGWCGTGWAGECGGAGRALSPAPPLRDPCSCSAASPVVVRRAFAAWLPRPCVVAAMPLRHLALAARRLRLASGCLMRKV